MHSRTTSEISTHSSSTLEFSYSDMESISSQFDIVDLSTPNEPPVTPTATPPTFINDLPPVKDQPHAPLVPQDIAKGEPKPEPKPIVHKDPLFYYENVILKVEDTLFCVPKSGLNEPGTYFNKLFTGPWYESERPGSSDDNPIALEGVSKGDFQAFLKLIFPSRSSKGIMPYTEAQWLAMLHLGTEWNFPDIKETALKHLEYLFKSFSPTAATTHDPIRALVLCLKYKIQQHLAHQFELIITSITPLKRDEMIAAGLDEATIQLIMEMREQWVCGTIWGMHGLHKLASEGKGVFAMQSPARSIVDKYLEHWPKITGWLVLRNTPSVNSSNRHGAPGWGFSTPKEPTTGRLKAEEKMRLEAQVKCLKDKEMQIAMKLTEEKEAAEAKRKEDQERIDREVAEKVVAEKEAAVKAAAEIAKKEKTVLKQKGNKKSKLGLSNAEIEERERKLKEEERRKKALMERLIEENRAEELRKEKEEREWAEHLEEQEKGGKSWLGS